MEQPEPPKTVEAYHTQERREPRLTEPVWSDSTRVWLGPAYYFWETLEFARVWAEEGKKIEASGGYSIYAADIDLTHNLDTCYSKEGSDLFIRLMDRAVARLERAESGRVDHLAALDWVFNEALADAGIEVITYCDVPQGARWRVTHPLHYKKRTQFAVLTKRALSNFRHLEDGTEVS